MPEQEQPEEQPQPVDLLTRLIDKATSAGEGGAAKGSSTPVYLIIASIVVLIISITSFMLVRARRKAAQLASQLRLKEEEKVQLEEKVELEKRAQDRLSLENDIAIKKIEINSINIKMERLNKESAARKASLAKLTNWDDLVVVDKRGEP